MTQKNALPDKQWLTTREVAQHLGLSPSGLRALVCKGEGPPCCRFNGARYMFHREDVEAWETEIRQQAREEVEERKHYALLRGLPTSPTLKALMS